LPRQEEALQETVARRIVRIGHRGAAGHAPENTLAAIRAGISLGVDFVEMDVRRTRDGRLIVLRTTDGNGLVSAMSWEEVQALGIGMGMRIGAGGRGVERVPGVQAALAAADGLAGVMLEVKSPWTGAELYRAVAASGFSSAVVYASFLHAELREIRRLDPQARTLALMGRVPIARAARARAAEANLVGLDHATATRELVAALHRAGLEVWVYTVNEPGRIARAIALGADGIISDYPERVAKVLAEN
jgi:glycerophosphoryl diester phosphodiesterase